MNREILFRGKSLETGKWLYGFYEDDRAEGVDFTVIVPLLTIENKPVSWEVEKTTVGQYTGLKDKNGKRIFEGDIVLQPVRETRKHSPCVIEFYNGCFMAHYKSENRFFDRRYNINSYTKIIGNIYDNPELLKQEGGRCG